MGLGSGRSSLDFDSSASLGFRVQGLVRVLGFRVSGLVRFLLFRV